MFLWRDKQTGKNSSSKFWKNVAFIVGTYIIVLNAVGLGWELFLVYLAVIGGSEVALKIVELRFGKEPKEIKEE